MSEWKKVKLGDLVTKITKGTTPSNIGESFCDRGIPFIRSELITQNKYISDVGLLYISKETHEKLKRSQLEANDILFSMAGVYLGKTAILRECDVPANTNQAVALIRLDSVLCNVDYIYYYLNQESVIRYVNQISGQAAQPNINLQQIGEIPIVIPLRKEQDNIATILSRYDTLIENCQKQIKLFEEAAQRLYKEWFVDLRFPGYENVKMVDGLPEGWERNRVGEIGTVITGKTPSTTKKENYGGFIPFITIPDMHSGIYPESSLYLSEIGANSQSGKFIPKDSLMVSCIGTAGLVCISKEQCQTNQQINSLILNDNAILYYMFFTFVLLKDHLNNIGSNGATMTNVNKSKFENIEVILPRKELIIRFNRFTEGSFAIIKNLSSQIRLLTEARDRLLPKLMGGEMEV